MAGILLQGLKSLVVTLSVNILSALLPVHFPANVPGKAMEDRPRTWGPDTQVADPDEFPGS